MIRPMIELAGFAAGFVAALAYLIMSLPAADILLVLATMLFAECLAACIATPDTRTPSAKRNPEHALSQTLLLWLLLLVALGSAMHLGILPLFNGQEFAVAGIAGLTLIFALLRLAVSTGQKGSSLLRLLIALRWGGICGAWALITEYAVLDASIMVLTAIMAGLLLLLSAGILVRRVQVRVAGRALMPVMPWWRYGDLLVLPFFLSGGEALGYLFARILAHPVLHGIGLLEQQALPLLTDATRSGASGRFVAHAARLNLGILLVGGSLALVILSFGRVLPDTMPLGASYLRDVIGWVVLGAAAPALLGASDAIFRAFGQTPVLGLMRAVALTGFATALALDPSPTAIETAQYFAGMHLGAAAIAAMILARSAGVWPGITALLLRQIRLL